jgi:hypothetical protein
MPDPTLTLLVFAATHDSALKVNFRLDWALAEVTPPLYGPAAI